MNKQDGIEERAEAFGDKDHPCCEGFNCYVCVADFTRTETATITAENNRLREMLRSVVEIVEISTKHTGFWYERNDTIKRAKALLSEE